MQLTVMTYNIGLALKSDLDALASIVGQADIVALQDVGNDWIEGPKGNQSQIIARMSGLGHSRFAAALSVRPDTDPPKLKPAPTPEVKPGFGVALISRYPLGPWTRHRLPKRNGQQRCLLAGTVVTPNGPISVLVTSLSTDPTDRMFQTPALLRHAQTQATPVIVAGCFNAEADEESMKILSPFLTNAAGSEAFPSYPTDNPQHAYDHIYVSKELEVAEPSMPVPLMGSDHLPVMTTLTIHMAP